jgi:hypothetical protein
MPEIPWLRRRRYEDGKLQASLGNIAKLYLKCYYYYY